MTEIISVRFKPGGKQYYFDPQGLEVKAGEGVILETSRGLEYGECTRGNHLVADEAVVQPLRPLVRLATEKDRQTVERNREKEKSAFQICQTKIAEHKLEMKLVDAEYSFEGNKVLFFFTSDGRVDFRALVKDLASHSMPASNCGRSACGTRPRCLGGLVSAASPSAVPSFWMNSSACPLKWPRPRTSPSTGQDLRHLRRLMCCLKYEQNAYEDAVRRCPKQESFVETPDGVGTVTSVNLLREQVKVRMEDSNRPA